MADKDTDNSGKKIRVFLVDDHAVIRDGLVKLINLEDDLLVCGEAGDSKSAMIKIQDIKPDVVIVDLSLKESSGLSLINDISIKFPKMPTFVLSMLDELLYAESALKAGAMGYIMKEEPAEKLLTGIRQVVAGKKIVSEAVTERMLDSLSNRKKGTEGSPQNILTKRELEIFVMIGKGLNSQLVAEKLQISTKTVDSHNFNIKNKLKLTNAAELKQFSVKWIISQEIA